MKRVIIALIFISILVSADTLTLNNGDEIYGKVISIQGDTVRFKKDGAGTENYAKSGLLKVSFLGYKRIPGENTLSDIKDMELRSLMERDFTGASFSGAGHATLIDEEHVTVHKDGSLTDRVRMAVRIFKERSRDLSNVSYYYKKGEEKGEISYARTILGDKVFYLNEESVQDESVFYTLKAYDKLHKVKFAIPKAAIDSVLDYSYETRRESSSISEPAYGTFYFVSKEPKLLCRLILEVDQGVDFAYELRNNEKGLVSVSEKKQGSRRIITFLMKDYPGYTGEDHMPPSSLIFPHVVWGINYGFKETATALQDSFKEKSGGFESVRDKVQQLTGNKSDADAKVRAIYEYVVKEISLKQVGMSSYSYIPKDLSEIFKNKYASVLDKTFVFHSMLKCAGLDSRFCYVSKRAGGQVAKGIGSIGQFSSACVYVPELKMYIFPHYEYYSYDEIPVDYQGSRIFDISSGTLSALPKVKAGENGEDMETRIKLFADGSVTVNEKTVSHGMSAATVRVKKAYTEKELDKSVEKRINAIHPNTTLVEYEYENMNRLFETPAFKAQYRISDYALKAGDRFLVFRIPGLLYNASSVGKPERSFPIYWGFSSSTGKKVQIELPPGYRVYYMPESFAISVDEETEYNVGYSDRDGKILFEDRRTTGWQIPVSDYAEYKKMMEKRARASQEWLVIEKE